ncbi:MAG: cyclic nucleotide-binding domain-containing protein [Pirellulales bacterium]|nr:cyclic nucleotide-binding domain-containing protein [Pirellulales bacterium]
MTMDPSEIMKFLGRIELFKDLDAEELTLLVEVVKITEHGSGTLLFEENSPRRKLFIIHRGEVELFKKSPYGKEDRLALFSQYDFLGEGALMDDYPHSTSARTLLASTILSISRDDFTALTGRKPSLAMKMLSRIARVISRRMRQTSSRVTNASAQYMSGRTRNEHDLLGERAVGAECYYGIQTLRALENFNISGVSLTHFSVLIHALAMVKMAAAKANMELNLLSKPVGDAIVQACGDILNGRYHAHFVVDMIQGGAGTSTNMNANEVIANIALKHLGYEKGEYRYCHPNNHVNVQTPLRRWHHGQCRPVPRARGTEHRPRDGAQSDPRLRTMHGTGQRGTRDEPGSLRTCPRETTSLAGTTQRTPGTRKHDPFTATLI